MQSEGTRSFVGLAVVTCVRPYPPLTHPLPLPPHYHYPVTDTIMTCTQERPLPALPMRHLQAGPARVLRARHAGAARPGRLPPGSQG